MVTSASSAMCYLKGMLTNRIDDESYTQIESDVPADEFYFYRSKSGWREPICIGLYVEKTDSNVHLASHLQLQTLVTFEKPTDLNPGDGHSYIDVLTVTEFQAEFQKVGAMWEPTHTDVEELASLFANFKVSTSHVSFPSNVLASTMIGFMHSVLENKNTSFNCLPLVHTTGDCYFFALPRTHITKPQIVGLCVPDVDSLHTLADKLGIHNLIYFGWNGDPIDMISSQTWRCAIQGDGVMFTT